MIVSSIRVGIVKGFLIGLRPYEYQFDELYEVDHVLYLGIFHITITTSHDIN